MPTAAKVLGPVMCTSCSLPALLDDSFDSAAALPKTVLLVLGCKDAEGSAAAFELVAPDCKAVGGLWPTAVEGAVACKLLVPLEATSAAETIVLTGLLYAPVEGVAALWPCVGMAAD